MTRVRFAPSPTGDLHIGGVRTALYSWLWARKNKGEFVLRIEDTDADRSTEESARGVIESMKWLGLDWDEGPFFQSERKDIYKEFAEKLIASGHAYRCYATKAEIDAAREAYGKKGFQFQSPWRDNPETLDKPSVVRFRAPKEGSTSWNDVVRGEISVKNNQQQDFILLRENGLPLYNFGCAVDDHLMKITLVARGDDHIINTPQQILIYEALGEEPPKFAHLPMVLSHNGKKLSKRDAAVGVLEYRDLGYVPDGVLNYLARLGWSHGDQELFTRQQLIDVFDWDNVGKTPGQYNLKKFLHVQAHHLREKSDAELATLVQPFLAKRGFDVPVDDALLLAAIAPVQLRSNTLDELANGLDYFFRDEITYEEKAKTKFLTSAHRPVLEGLLAIVTESEPFIGEALEKAVHDWCEKDELKMKDVAQPARAALTGRTKSPGLFETMVLLGKEKTLARLNAGIAITNG